MHKLTNDRRKWGQCAFVAGSGLLALSLLIGIPCPWVRLPRAVVSFDGQPSSRATVYRSLDGRLLLWIEEPAADEAFVILPSEHDVVRAHGGSILNGGDYLVAPFLALSRADAVINGHLRGEPLSAYPDEKVGTVNPRMVFRRGCVEFTEELFGDPPPDFRGNPLPHSRRVSVRFR